MCGYVPVLRKVHSNRALWAWSLPAAVWGPLAGGTFYDCGRAACSCRSGLAHELDLEVINACRTTVEKGFKLNMQHQGSATPLKVKLIVLEEMMKMKIKVGRQENPGSSQEHV
ncbi:hypothetical protein DFH09DRAFT_1083159 [Mycena vulgaris]|nr:hypothetical protein DFH09DRAFT_1083159 [Mycena vulgaris]